jgi:hypothetical protein
MISPELQQQPCNWAKIHWTCQGDIWISRTISFLTLRWLYVKSRIPYIITDLWTQWERHELNTRFFPDGRGAIFVWMFCRMRLQLCWTCEWQEDISFAALMNSWLPWNRYDGVGRWWAVVSGIHWLFDSFSGISSCKGYYWCNFQYWCQNYTPRVSLWPAKILKVATVWTS